MSPTLSKWQFCNNLAKHSSFIYFFLYNKKPAELTQKYISLAERSSNENTIVEIKTHGKHIVVWLWSANVGHYILAYFYKHVFKVLHRLVV